MFILFNNEFLFIFIIMFFIFFLSCLILLISYTLTYHVNDISKLSSYECGFLPFEDTRRVFEIEFYLVGILFVIFDLEIVFLFPLCLCLDIIGFFGIFWVYVFLVILTIGFIYEWLKGGLDW